MERWMSYGSAGAAQAALLYYSTTPAALSQPDARQPPCRALGPPLPG